MLNVLDLVKNHIKIGEIKLKENEKDLRLVKQKIKELKLVDVQELQTDIGPIFLLKIGGENVRLYLSRDEANIVKEYMTKVILVTIIEFLLGSNINIGTVAAKEEKK